MSYEDKPSLDYLMHYGTPRHSGRYPWGSGENPYQHSGDFLSRVDELKKQGLSETQIAESFNISTTQLRAQLTMAKSERRALLVAQAKSLKADGLGDSEIARRMGLKGESTVRSLLNEDAETRMNLSMKTAENLKKLVDEKGMIDVGTGTELQLGISKEKMAVALEILQEQGYEVYGGRVQQATNKGKYTTLKVLCPPGTEHKEIYDYDKIHSVSEYTTRDDGDTLEPSFVYPASLDSSRLAIRYAEDGGREKDGVVEIRRGVADLSLGESNYAQVRILVDGTHYIKGMAVYSDDLPEGTDLIFNTNKTSDKSKMEVLKKIKDDPENPFGSSIKEHGGQSYYIDENGESHLSLINKRADEGDWGDWSDHLPSQFLSKQSMTLIRKQLNLSASDKQDEYDEIMSLTNPTVKRALLESFADDCDAASVHLKAAALPGQKYQVILPLTSVGDNEVYAPNFTDGTEVALIRYPHGGTFEIPILKVNNGNKEGRSVIGNNALDAVGISSKVAERLSGADFDGDTVMVIPLNNKVKITSTPPLKQLEGFDTKLNYGPAESYTDDKGNEHYIRNGKEYKLMRNTQTEMGKISNLITDMTLKGATEDELARAVKHSMVVIDAEKHHLDYKQSEDDNKIASLKKKYQDGGGASTLISQSKKKELINERKEGAFFTRDGNEEVTLFDQVNQLYLDKNGVVYNKKEVKTVYTDPNTGEKMYHDTNRQYYKTSVKDLNGKSKTVNVINKDNKYYYKDDDGKYVQVPEERVKTLKATAYSTKMAETKDARLLSSGTPQEEAYAEYANRLKSLANQARKESLAIKDIPYSPEAKKTYSNEVESLLYKLNQAKLNAPKERQAQIIAATAMKAKVQEDPKMTSEKKAKLNQQELAKARQKVGAKRAAVVITEKEWEAIQAGAITHTRLEEIIANSDTATLRQLATPRTTTTLSTSKVARMKNMSSSGYTNSEIADALGVSASTVNKYLSGKEN